VADDYKRHDHSADIPTYAAHLIERPVKLLRKQGEQPKNSTAQLANTGLGRRCKYAEQAT